MSGVPNSGLIYNAGQPTDNGGSFEGVSTAAVVGAGSRPVAQGRLVPPSAASQAPINTAGAVPSPAAAAAAVRAPQVQAAQAQQLPPAARAQAGIYPTAYAANAVAVVPPPQQQPTAASLTAAANGIPRSVNSAETRGNKFAVIGDNALDIDLLSNFGTDAIKARVITMSAMVTPAHHKARSFSVKLNENTYNILRHKTPKSGCERVGSLDKVIIVALELIACKNELPFNVGVNVAKCRGRDYDFTTGERALLHMPPHYSEEPGNRKIYMAAKNLSSMSNFRRFGQLKEEHINEGIKPMDGEQFSWVKSDCAVANVIRASYETLKPTLANVRVVENYLPVKNKLVANIQNFLRDKIASVPGEDMRDASIELTRSAACNFSEACDIIGDKRTVEAEYNTPCAVYVKMLAYYVILSNCAGSGNAIEATSPGAAELFKNHVAAGTAVAQPAAQLAGV
jgi:hypothetical protein